MVIELLYGSITPSLPDASADPLSLTMTTPEKLNRIVEKLQRASSPRKRHEVLLSYAKRLPQLPDSAKIPDNKVPGCTSQVFMTADLDEGKVHYQGDSDSQLVKGLVALLIEGLNDLPPQEILAVTPEFIERSGLQVSLTPSRANGFYNVFHKMQQLAQAHATRSGDSEPRAVTAGEPS